MPTREHTVGLVFECIDVYYNRKRPHLILGYLSPEAFESRKLLSQVSGSWGQDYATGMS